MRALLLSTRLRISKMAETDSDLISHAIDLVPRQNNPDSVVKKKIICLVFSVQQLPFVESIPFIHSYSMSAYWKVPIVTCS